MTYSPGSPGYPSNQPGGSYSGGTPSFAKDDDGTSKLPLYLTIAVAALGLLAYLASFGPILTHPALNSNGDVGSTEGTSLGAALAVIAALLAGLLAAVSLVPKAKNHVGVTAAVSVLALLLLISGLVNTGSGVTIAWGGWLVLIAVVLEAAAAVGALLLDSGVISAPAPRPKYDPYAQQYGQYGQQYGQYGQQPYYGQQQHGGQQSHNPQQQQQQPGYGGQYGGYQSSQAPTQSVGGFGGAPQSGSQPAVQQHGTNTPPTGFPSFSPPPSSGGTGAEGGAGSANYSGQSEGQQSYGQGQQQSPQSPA